MHANNEKLVEELYKPIIKKLKKRTVYSGFKDNIWGGWFNWYALNKQF